MLEFGHEVFSISNILSNEQFNEYEWYSIQFQGSNTYVNCQCCGRRHMPVLYDYDD